MLRDAVNRQGRDRATVDGGLQESKFPRCLLLVTAETGPPDGSGVPRTLVLPVVAEDKKNGVVGTLDPDVLAGLPRAGAAGLFARAMAAFLRWLAPQYDAVRLGLGDEVERRARDLREEMADAGLHARTPEIAIYVKASAAERKSGSMAGRKRFSFGPRVSRITPGSSSRCMSGGAT